MCDGQNDCIDNSDEPAGCPPFYCIPGQFQCANKQCISPNQICDGVAQCADKSDEKDCEVHICSSTQFKCPKHGNSSSYCIKKTKLCDGQTDCAGNEDELNCPEKHCPKDQFKCAKSGKCIQLSFFCDGQNDCGSNDLSDEPPETCGNQTSCVQDHIYCKLGYCMGNKWLCEQPYSCLDKEFCYNEGECLMDKIVENSSSSSNSHTFSRPKCECKDKLKYKGERCERCDKLSCQNGGWCTYPVNFTAPECKCAAGYLGHQCEKSLCDKYCSNSAICRLVSGIPKCICINGYIGKTCAQDTCSGYCLNSGICQRNEDSSNNSSSHHIDKRKCVCANGFSGRRCEINKCGCLNGGTCASSNSPNGICVCPASFMGAHCERFIATSCKKVECNNGGICKINEHDQQAYCECPKEFKGIFCDIPVTSSNLDCKDYYCLNGGTCMIVNRTSLACSCLEGKFNGNRCENMLTSALSKDERSLAGGSKKLLFISLAISIFFVSIFIFLFGFTFKAYRR